MTRIDRNAFTLAETLIVIGLLGIVAALAMPQVAANYMDKVYKTHYTAAVSKFSQAIESMYANDSIVSFKGTEDFVKELQKQMKVVKVCKNNELGKCFPQGVKMGQNSYQFNSEFDMCASSFLARANRIMNPPKNGSEVAGMLGDSGLADIPMMMGFNDYDATGVVLADGTSMLITFNPDCKNSSNDIFKDVPNINIPKNKSIKQCAAAIIDVNSINPPNEFGHDIFYYNINACNALY